jgi:hypothetical protein
VGTLKITATSESQKYMLKDKMQQLGRLSVGGLESPAAVVQILAGNKRFVSLKQHSQL